MELVGKLHRTKVIAIAKLRKVLAAGRGQTRQPGGCPPRAQDGAEPLWGFPAPSQPGQREQFLGLVTNSTGKQENDSGVTSAPSQTARGQYKGKNVGAQGGLEQGQGKGAGSIPTLVSHLWPPIGYRGPPILNMQKPRLTEKMPLDQSHGTEWSWARDSPRSQE